MRTVRLEYIHEVRAKGRTYYYHRQTRERLSDEPSARARRALEINEALEAQAKRGRDAVRDPGSISSLIEHYKSSPDFRTKKPRTRADYDKRLAFFAEHYGDFQVSEIDTEFVLEIQAAFSEHPRQADYIVAVLSILCSFACNRPRIYRLQHNPCRAVKKIWKAKGHDRWPDDAISKFIVGARPHMLTALMLGLYLTQREADVISLGPQHRKVNDFWIRQQKTDKRLEIPGHPDLIDYISHLPRGNLVYVMGPRGRGYTVDGFRTEFYKERKRLGLLGYTFHGLRHTAVAKLLEAGCTEDQVMAVTGFGRQTIQKYAKHTNQKMLAELAIAKLPKNDD